MKIIYKDMPREVRQLLVPLFKQHKDLAPSWCDRLYVSFDSEPGSGRGQVIATICTTIEYGFAEMTICPHWLEISEERRENAIVHELVHVVNAHVQDFASELEDHLGADPNSPFARWVNRECTKAVETTTCAMTNAWLAREASLRKLLRPKPAKAA